MGSVLVFGVEGDGGTLPVREDGTFEEAVEEMRGLYSHDDSSLPKP
jgi:hypothetical protein